MCIDYLPSISNALSCFPCSYEICSNLTTRKRYSTVIIDLFIFDSVAIEGFKLRLFRGNDRVFPFWKIIGPACLNIGMSSH